MAAVSKTAVRKHIGSSNLSHSAIIISPNWFEFIFEPIFIGMNYLIYKITNKLNNKIYVGKHKTEFLADGYFGSGLLLKRAVEKHGKENFTREILFECKSEEEMNQKEADIVDEEFVSRDDTYNIMLGGNGGFDYINSENKNGNDVNRSPEHYVKMGSAAANKIWKKWESDPNFREEFRVKLSNRSVLYQLTNGNPFKGKKHSDETKQKMREARKGKVDGNKNPSFGKHWITNGLVSKLVPKENFLPRGFRKGRV